MVYKNNIALLFEMGSTRYFDKCDYDLHSIYEHHHEEVQIFGSGSEIFYIDIQ
jgi:hypothetical protein